MSTLTILPSPTHASSPRMIMHRMSATSSPLSPAVTNRTIAPPDGGLSGSSTLLAQPLKKRRSYRESAEGTSDCESPQENSNPTSPKKAKHQWKTLAVTPQFTATNRTTGAISIGRCHHTATLVHDDETNRDQLLIFGGYGGPNVYFNDVELIDIQSCECHSVVTKGKAPNARRSHTACLIPGTKQVVIFGGRYCNWYFNDCHFFDIETHTWTKKQIWGKLPSKRAGHTSFIVGRELIIFGGERYDKNFDTSFLFSDIFALNLDTMECREVNFDKNKPKPDPRVYHTFTPIYDDPNDPSTFKEAYLFGGLGPNCKRLQDMWCLKQAVSQAGEKRWQWIRCETSGFAPPHETHAAVPVVGGPFKSIYMIGGRGSLSLTQETNCIYEFNIESMRWKQYGTKVPPRDRHIAFAMCDSLTSDTKNNKAGQPPQLPRIYLHGGLDQEMHLFNSMQVIHLSTFQKEIADLFGDQDDCCFGF